MSIILENNAFNLKQDNDGVFHWHFYSGILSLEDYMLGYNYGLQNYKESSFLLLATHDHNFHFSSEAWSFMTDKNTDFTFVKAHAIVITQLHLRILASIFSKLKKSTYQTKIFSNKEKALEWLKTWV